MSTPRITAVLALLLLPAAAGALISLNHLDGDAEMLAILDEENLAFVAEGRIGDRGGAATFELDLGPSTSAPAVTAQYDWQSDLPETFSIEYDGTTLRFRLGGQLLEYEPAGAMEEIFIRARAVNAQTVVFIEELYLDGLPLNDHCWADGDLSGLDILWIGGAELEGGFALLGTATLNWGGAAPTQSRLAFQVKVGVVEPPAAGSATLSRVKALY